MRHYNKAKKEKVKGVVAKGDNKADDTEKNNAVRRCKLDPGLKAKHRPPGCQSLIVKRI